MCTVSIVPRRDGYRLVCNRDERRSREVALEPRPRAIGSCLAIHPVDPQGGGTWVAANDAGLALALLNRTDDPARVFVGRYSRGSIIPLLLGHSNLDGSVRAAARIDPSRYAPFRLVIVRENCCAVVSGDGSAHLSVALTTFHQPLLFTSSSLGDSHVDTPRRRLFGELVLGRSRGWIDGQRAFHHHRWPQRPELSVTMNRADARTVSRTVVDVTRGRAILRYESIDDASRAENLAWRGAA